jgi:transposase
MKGRKSHNKGKSKWGYYEPQIIELILKGFSENKIKKTIGCSNGSIHRIKQKIKSWGGDAGIEWAQRKLEQIDKEFNIHYETKDEVKNELETFNQRFSKIMKFINNK